jgi:hypothetical protein
MKDCKKCGEFVSENAKTCRYCGYEFYGHGGLIHLFPPGKPRKIATICISLLVTLFVGYILSGTSTGIGVNQILFLGGIFVFLSAIGLIAG